MFGVDCGQLRLGVGFDVAVVGFGFPALLWVLRGWCNMVFACWLVALGVFSVFDAFWVFVGLILVWGAWVG